MNDEIRRPKAVCVSDIHFSIANLDLASSALEQAIAKAQELRVPLIIAGDLTDQKAIIRAEVANRLINILKRPKMVDTYIVDICIIVGNHDMINEKGDAHALHFLEPYANIISTPYRYHRAGVWLLPYYNDSAKLLGVLETIPKGSTIIMHQGVMGANMGHYVKDSTSLPREAFADFRVISGHYHKAQDIKCGRPRKGAVGLFSYIGSPYTISFGETGDGPKGFRVLMSDGTLESVPTDLRRHIIIEMDFENQDWSQDTSLKKEDLLWLKITAPPLVLAGIKKERIAASLPMGMNFKLDKIPTDREEAKPQEKSLKDTEALDALIDRTGEPKPQKDVLKALWRELLNANS